MNHEHSNHSNEIAVDAVLAVFIHSLPYTVELSDNLLGLT